MQFIKGGFSFRLKSKLNVWMRSFNESQIMTKEINSLRLEFGQTNETCERFIQLCLLRGSNVPGEPKLAAEFLADLSRT